MSDLGLRPHFTWTRQDQVLCQNSCPRVCVCIYCHYKERETEVWHCRFIFFNCEFYKTIKWKSHVLILILNTVYLPFWIELPVETWQEMMGGKVVSMLTHWLFVHSCKRSATITVHRLLFHNEHPQVQHKTDRIPQCISINRILLCQQGKLAI